MQYIARNGTLLYERYSEETASYDRCCHNAKRGDDMKIGFIGAGKAGCSLGKYFSMQNIPEIQVSGYSSLEEEEARWAAAFTNSEFFQTGEEVFAASDSVILSTPDGVIERVWDCLDKDLVKGKIVCHLSGSLSSDVFSGIEEYGGYPISIHPMFAFSSKDSVYEQLKEVSFTLEGNPYALKAWKHIFSLTGNDARSIEKDVKAKYHAAASLLSNHVVAVLSAGYQLLEECGFTKEEARSFSRILVQDNVNHVIEMGEVNALTGPIERGDVETIEKHLKELTTSQRDVYKACGKILTELAIKKHPQRSYETVKNYFR